MENDTPLMIAAYDGHADVVRLLIKLGARLDELDKVRELRRISRVGDSYLEGYLGC